MEQIQFPRKGFEPKPGDIWPERKRFRELVKIYRALYGKSMAEFAEALGVSVTTVYGYTSRPDQIPSIAVKLKAAKLLGVNPSELDSTMDWATNEDARPIEEELEKARAAYPTRYLREATEIPVDTQHHRLCLANRLSSLVLDPDISIKQVEAIVQSTEAMIQAFKS